MRVWSKSPVFSVLLLLGAIFTAGWASGTVAVAQERAGIKSVTTRELQGRLGKENWVVVDTRINDAFNGWKLDGVARGGHIAGAVDFAARWLTVSDKDRDARLQQVLKAKGITPEKNVVLYDANGKDALEVGAGYEPETKANEKTPVVSLGAKVPVNRSYIVDMPDFRNIDDTMRNASVALAVVALEYLSDVKMGVMRHLVFKRRLFEAGLFAPRWMERYGLFFVCGAAISALWRSIAPPSGEIVGQPWRSPAPWR